MRNLKYWEWMLKTRNVQSDHYTIWIEKWYKWGTIDLNNDFLCCYCDRVWKIKEDMGMIQTMINKWQMTNSFIYCKNCTDEKNKILK